MALVKQLYNVCQIEPNKEEEDATAPGVADKDNFHLLSRFMFGTDESYDHADFNICQNI